MKNSGARVSRSFTNFSFDDVAKAFLDFVFEYNLLAFDWNVLSGFDLDQSPSAGPTGSSLDIMCTQWVVLEGDLLISYMIIRRSSSPTIASSSYCRISTPAQGGVRGLRKTDS